MKKKFDMNELKKQFDKIYIRHEKGEDGKGGRSEAILVKDGNVFGGVSLCHGEDQFNKSLGRQVAIGRALHAMDVFQGKKPARRRRLEIAFYGRITHTTEDDKPSILIEKCV